MNETMAVIFLLGCSFYDYKWKQIPVWILLLGSSVGLVCKTFEIYVFHQDNWSSLVIGLLPGICVTGMAYLSKDRIGVGDGLVLMVLGFFLKVGLTILAAALGLFLTTIFGIGLVLFRKATFQTALPFVPFLTVGLSIVLRSVMQT